ncbi:MAG: c(7)-type cytochrome triheme domain-containing protein [Nitrospirota bacterium]|nr:c(7)-type cytochrome triheme domain-containing protein [Nitrospirota bacterium]
MLQRLITVLSLIVLLVSCKWKTGEEVLIIEEPESPIIDSLRDSSLPCLQCHDYEKFAVQKRGEFSHRKHMDFGVHCNQCHIIRAHNELTINRDVCGNCHKLADFSYDAFGMPVKFAHQSHANKFNCGECHPRSFNMKKGATKITMEAMYNGGSCGKCHNGNIAFPTAKCKKCHDMSGFKKELSYQSGGISRAVFSHETHTAMFDCDRCHTSVFKFRQGGSGMKMDDIYQGKFCGSCHNDRMAFGPMSCKKCHK